MIDVITSTYKIGEGEVTPITSSNLPAYLDYSVSYSDGEALAQYQELKAGDTETYKVRVEFKKDIDENDLPSTAQAIVFIFAVDYVQADSNATKVIHMINGTIYSQSYLDVNGLYFGESVASHNRSVWCIVDGDYNSCIEENYVFESEEECLNYAENCELGSILIDAIDYIDDISEINRDTYLKFNVENNIISDAYVCNKNNSEFCLHSGNDNFFSENKSTMQSLVGWINEKGGSCSFNDLEASCFFKEGNSGISILAQANGLIEISELNYDCNPNCFCQPGKDGIRITDTKRIVNVFSSVAQACF